MNEKIASDDPVSMHSWNIKDFREKNILPPLTLLGHCLTYSFISWDCAPIAVMGIRSFTSSNKWFGKELFMHKKKLSLSIIALRLYGFLSWDFRCSFDIQVPFLFSIEKSTCWIYFTSPCLLFSLFFFFYTKGNIGIVTFLPAIQIFPRAFLKLVYPCLGAPIDLSRYKIYFPKLYTWLGY